MERDRHRSAFHPGRVAPAATVGGVVRRHCVDVFRLWRIKLCVAHQGRARSARSSLTLAETKEGQLVAPRRSVVPGRQGRRKSAYRWQWADAHNSLAQAWVTADQTHAAYVRRWSKAHDDDVKDWIKKNTCTPQPTASDFAVRFGVGGAVPRGIPYPDQPLIEQSTELSLSLDMPKPVSLRGPPPYFDAPFLHQPLQKDPGGLQPIARFR
jgi:hypothetical protein